MHHPHQNSGPRLVAWELTNRCNLHCKHCRAADAGERDPRELNSKEASTLITQLSEFAPLILILSGGEPLVREDIIDIIRQGNSAGLRIALATNGTLLDDSIAKTIKREGVARVSMSLDGLDAKTHDSIRGLDGAYDLLMQATERLKKVDLPFQINTTVMTQNVDDLERIVKFVPTLGAVEHHIFMFVPTGRGENISDESIGKERYEEVLRFLAEAQKENPIHLQITCGPQYQRILRQTDNLPEDPRKRGGGCMAGTGFVFVSSVGEVYPCGYLPALAGDVRKNTFGEIWRDSELFLKLRDRSSYKGRCGACEYRKVCGGCRARAYALNGDYLGEEPFCMHTPSVKGRPNG